MPNALPKPLQQAIASALECVRTQPRHHLFPAMRRAIYAGFGPYGEGGYADSVAARACALL